VNWSSDVADRTQSAFAGQGNPERAVGAFRYMKGVAPFLGIAAPDRRALLRAAWKSLPQPTSSDLGDAALSLAALTEREYHYAAYDLIDRYRASADADFMRTYATALLTSVPWWDTVDGLVTAMVSPVLRRYPDGALVDAWSVSGDRWLVRTAITHQRGWKSQTDVPRVLALCDAHWRDPEFFVAKAIGWALRDIARMQPDAVRGFLAEHDDANRVAIREARRGLAG
jgi:3-methyladenine DNA glycosylase AlkD